jgi:hypothetical protein
MASIINADNGVVSGSAGLKTSADSTGVLSLQTNGTNAVTVDTSQNATFNSTGSLTIPVGTTAQRPASPANGMIRFNTTLGYNEWYSASISAWLPLSDGPTYTVEFLVIAGGGAGGSQYGGGGGAGGFRSSVLGFPSGGNSTAESVFIVTPSTSYGVVIGAGGTGVSGPSTGNNGNVSTFATITSLGGGGGGWRNAGGADSASGLDGGSGGGGPDNYSSGQRTGGSGTAGQGYAGGGIAGVAVAYLASGGGGAGAVGVANSSGGTGGAGLASPITGTSVTYAGGGGGGNNVGFAPGNGGTGGGGRGGGSTGPSVAGTINTGGGGGGGGDGAYGNSAGGGSGIVIIRYLGSQRGTGGVITNAGGYTIHTFTASGSYTA